MTTFELISIGGILVGIILSVLSLAGIAYIAGVKMTSVEKELEHLKGDFYELKQNVITLSDFIFRRGIAEAVINGSAKMNSPVVVTEEAKSLFADLKPDLKKLAQANANASDSELGFLIERKWGDFILKKICIPRGMTQGACLLIAVSVAKEND